MSLALQQPVHFILNAPAVKFVRAWFYLFGQPSNMAPKSKLAVASPRAVEHSADNSARRESKSQHKLFKTSLGKVGGEAHPSKLSAVFVWQWFRSADRLNLGLQLVDPGADVFLAGGISLQ